MTLARNAQKGVSPGTEVSEDQSDYTPVWTIGVILGRGEVGDLDPHFLEWGTDPHFRSLSSQKFCLEIE